MSKTLLRHLHLKAQLSLNKLAMDRLKIMFHTVYTLNLHGRPASDYCWRNDLDVVKGLNIGKVYRNSKKCCEFRAAIAQVQCNESSNHIAECKFVAVIVDGSMNSSITDNEMVYIQTCHEGSICTNFV